MVRHRGTQPVTTLNHKRALDMFVVRTNSYKVNKLNLKYVPSSLNLSILHLPNYYQIIELTTLAPNICYLSCLSWSCRGLRSIEFPTNVNVQKTTISWVIALPTD